MKAQAYLSFDGNCQEALSFYKGILGGEVVNRETWEGKETDIPEHYRNKLQHAELKGKGFHFMAYDAAPDTPLTSGNKVCMSLDYSDKAEAKSVFEALSAQGKINSPFQETSWNAHYGRCTDQFGVEWMVNAK